MAALQGNIEAIRQHIEAGSDLNDKDVYGSSPLIIAATFGKTEVARALIEAGADMNITNNDGATALHAAAFLCRTEIVKALLDNGRWDPLQLLSMTSKASTIASDRPLGRWDWNWTTSGFE
jgi:ankyrin repeat protein